jgi:hypothetical protein
MHGYLFPAILMLSQVVGLFCRGDYLRNAVHTYKMVVRILENAAFTIKRALPDRVKEISRRIIPKWIITAFDPLFRK